MRKKTCGLIYKEYWRIDVGRCETAGKKGNDLWREKNWGDTVREGRQFFQEK